LIYSEWAERLSTGTIPGVTIEIGGGSNPVTATAFEKIGSFRFDLVRLPGIPVHGDAMNPPISAQSVANVVGIDVLHRCQSGEGFFLRCLAFSKLAANSALLSRGTTSGSALSVNVFIQSRLTPIVRGNSPMAAR
jgi:hypothetical protein